MPKEGSTISSDLLRGQIIVENNALDDSILLKSDGLPTYHLGAMVDDHLMKITHVVRGAEWLSTFPLHVNVVRAFGWEEPIWVHLSLFLKPSGRGKMSKREAAEALKDDHSIFIGDMKELGYIPEGVLNWIVLMGWGVAENEVMTLDEMVTRFDVSSLSPSPAAINFAKLDYFNGAHIRQLTTDDLVVHIKPYFANAGYKVDESILLRIIPLIRERLVTLDDCLPFAAWFFKETVEPKPEDLVAKSLTASQSADIARKIYDILEALPDINQQTAEPPMRLLIEELNLSANQVFGILRVAVTGQTVSPPLFESMELVGKKMVLERVKNAIMILEKL
jgi:glutamyl-tRNA synthetase